VISPRFRDALEESIRKNRITFLSAGPGWGKTTAVREALRSRRPQWLAPDRQDALRVSAQAALVVLDDFQTLPAGPGGRVEKLLGESGGRHFVILSRAPLPRGLLSGGYDVCRLDAGDLALELPGISRLARLRGVELSGQQLAQLRTFSRGWPVLVELLLSELAVRGVPGRETWQAALARLELYWDRVFFCRLSADARELLLRTAFFDSFTPGLARALTGREWTAGQLELLQSESGAILPGRGEEWSLAEPAFMGPYLRRKAEAALQEDGLRELFRTGGAWYALAGDDRRSALYAQRAGDRQGSLDALCRHVCRDAGARSVAKLRGAFACLPPEDARSSPVLLYALCLLSALELRPRALRGWHEALLWKAGEPDGFAARRWLALADAVCLPRNAARGQEEGEPGYPPCSFTAGLPSVLCCCQDLSEPLRLDAPGFVKRLGPALAPAVGRCTREFQELLLAEWRLERGENDSEMFLRWFSLQSRLRQAGAMELEFVCVALMLRCLCAAGQRTDAASLLAYFRRRAENQGAADLLPGIDALHCRLSLLSGGDYAGLWLSRQPEPGQLPFLLDKFRCSAMVRCYMAQEDYPAAMILLGQFMDRLEGRPLDELETLILTAVCCFRTGGEAWRGYWKRALELGSRYGYTALFAQEGAALLPLLERSDGEGTPPEYWDQVIRQTILQAGMYPGYLRPRRSVPEPLTPREMSVLQLVCLHKSNEEISEALGIALNTVKSHLHHVCLKLGVTTRQQVIEAAGRVLAQP